MDGPLSPLEPARAPLEPVNLRRERHAKFPEVQRRSPAATLTLFLLLTFFAIASGTNPHDCRRFGHERLSLVVPWIPQVISPDLNLNATCPACGSTCSAYGWGLAVSEFWNPLLVAADFAATCCEAGGWDARWPKLMDSPTELSDGPLRTVYASICASLSTELRYPLVADHDSAAAATCSACGWEACWPKLIGVPAELSGTPRCTVLGNASPFADTQCANPSCCFTGGPSEYVLPLGLLLPSGCFWLGRFPGLCC